MYLLMKTNMIDLFHNLLFYEIKVAYIILVPYTWFKYNLKGEKNVNHRCLNII